MVGERDIGVAVRPAAIFTAPGNTLSEFYSIKGFRQANAISISHHHDDLCFCYTDSVIMARSRSTATSTSRLGVANNLPSLLLLLLQPMGLRAPRADDSDGTPEVDLHVFLRDLKEESAHVLHP